ncbi:MAG: NAD(+) kinase [Pseudomonadales bacterium]|jgi:NAD+ kinase|nr:NAD(+) kinase [Pseudomonadales bacterium]
MHFNSVGIIAKTGSDQVLDSLRHVVEFLAGQDVDVVLETESASMLGDDSRHCELAEMGDCCDLVIAVGGDGNILGAARALAPAGVPILGVNRGRLGFLADVSPHDIEPQVGAVLAGDFVMEEHFLLEGQVTGRSDVCSALNEVLIHAANMPKMIEFDLTIYDELVYTQHSDGLIISTPTGSTAYALSAGGPIMHPSIDAVVLVPMFPHTLTSRPLVIPGDFEMKVVIGSHNEVGARVSFDSQIEFEIEPGDELVVRKKKKRLKLIHPPGHSFYEVCRGKLDWASRVGDNGGD